MSLFYKDTYIQWVLKNCNWAVYEKKIKALYLLQSFLPIYQTGGHWCITFSFSQQNSTPLFVVRCFDFSPLPGFGWKGFGLEKG